ncbi:MAG TPA: hypothetical protein VE129_08125 [Thermoanaerobaculia bacterium]|nr:hypothetical protein [Thermoanaerobaculia bacterium]
MTESSRVHGERLFPLGAIAGDVIGSVHERAGTKTADFALFTPASSVTEDSVLTVAGAEVFSSGRNYTDSMQRWALAIAAAVILARPGSSKNEIRYALATDAGSPRS